MRIRALESAISQANGLLAAQPTLVRRSDGETEVFPVRNLAEFLDHAVRIRRQGHRLDSAGDLGWISFVRRLRSTGMPMRRVAEYTGMIRRGDDTLSDRRRLLEQHRTTVASAIAELTDALRVLDNKIDNYEAAERGVAVGDEPLQFVPQLG